MADNKKNSPGEKEELEKLLGANVPESLYWKFKKAAAERNEKMQDAIIHAAYLYIDVIPGREGA